MKMIAESLFINKFLLSKKVRFLGLGRLCRFLNGGRTRRSTKSTPRFGVCFFSCLVVSVVDYKELKLCIICKIGEEVLSDEIGELGWCAIFWRQNLKLSIMGENQNANWSKAPPIFHLQLDYNIIVVKREIILIYSSIRGWSTI